MIANYLKMNFHNMIAIIWFETMKKSDWKCPIFVGQDLKIDKSQSWTMQVNWKLEYNSRVRYCFQAIHSPRWQKWKWFSTTYESYWFSVWTSLRATKKWKWFRINTKIWGDDEAEKQKGNVDGLRICCRKCFKEKLKT